MEYIKKTSIYSIIIIISTLKLKELIGQFISFDFSSQKIYYLKLIFLVSHLISVPLSFAGNKKFKFLTVLLHLSTIIVNNLEWSKEEFLDEIKSFNVEFLQKYFFEIGILLSIFIFFDSLENLENKVNKGNKGEQDEKNKNKEEKSGKRRNQRNKEKKYIKSDGKKEESESKN